MAQNKNTFVVPPATSASKKYLTRSSFLVPVNPRNQPQLWARFNSTAMELKFSVLFLVATSIFPSVLAWTNEYNNRNTCHSQNNKNGGSDSLLKSHDQNLVLSRRGVFGSAVSTTATIALWPFVANGQSNEDSSALDKLHFRDRKSNKGTLIREDYWFMMGKTPPRKLDGPLITDDPEFNAFGSCETSQSNGGGSNSCTYVSLKQRIPTYSKYGFSIAFGAKEYSMLGKSLRKGDLKGAVPYLLTEPTQTPPPSVDALLKMVLFASGMLTSPNYSGPSKRLLVARFYANEVGFAIEEIKDAIDAQDQQRAIAAWEFGKDSWNSYFQIVNDSISVKVGDKFEPIS